MAKISKSFLIFLAFGVFFIPVTILHFISRDYITAVCGLCVVLILLVLAAFFQLRKVRAHQIIEPEQILEEELEEAVKEELDGAERSSQEDGNP